MLKQLGPYRLEKLLGRGGMGSVYTGVHEETGERAAIKALSMTLADDENFRARFLVEIETLKQLRHPNIVRILGDGEQDGQLFYVMELVEGRSLQEMLQIGYPFEWHEVSHIAIEVCGALKHAHDCGVIHRDLKPANLLRMPDGHIKLTDFGIAKLFGATHRTADGSVVGTADFMAPEQADSRPITNRTDLYSLGAVMFTLLARRTPFQGGSLVQLVHKLKYEEAPSVRRYAPNVPQELDLIISELLRKDPQQRVATALVLANRLRAMEHALIARQELLITPDAQITRLAPAEDKAESGAPANFGHDPTKAIGGTSLDEESSSENRNYWNEPTLITSTPEPDLEKSAAGPPELVEPPPPPPPPANRFTTIDEDKRLRADQKNLTPHETESNARAITVTAVLLAGIVAVCVWGMLPPSADTLYDRIHQTAQQQGLSDAVTDIELFLKRYPNDPRSGEVDDLRRDIESDWLESRLRVRKRKTDGTGLESYEQKWLEAYLIRHKDPRKSTALWQSILDEYGEVPNPPESLQAILAATRHELKRIAASRRSTAAES